METKVKLNKELQKKLDGYGDTPVSEPEIFKLIEKSSKKDLALLLLSREEIVEKYSAAEVGEFLHAVENKITGFLKEDGTFKSTPKTENCQLPNFLEVEELIKLGDAQQEAQKNIDATDEDSLKAYVDATTALAEASYKISGLDISTLSEWEKALVATTVFGTAINATLSSMGKRLKR